MEVSITLDDFKTQPSDAEDDEDYLDEAEPIAEEQDDLDDEAFEDELDSGAGNDLDDDDADGDEADQINAGIMPPTERLTGLVHYVAAKLVADPADIELSAEQRGGTVYVGLRVPESDLGRVIGRGGRTAQAIRTLVSIAGSKHHLHARLDIDG